LAQGAEKACSQRCIPAAAKAACIAGSDGTTEVVPFPSVQESRVFPQALESRFSGRGRATAQVSAQRTGVILGHRAHRSG
jgi:hypothetical protein